MPISQRITHRHFVPLISALARLFEEKRSFSPEERERFATIARNLANASPADSREEPARNSHPVCDTQAKLAGH